METNRPPPPRRRLPHRNPIFLLLLLFLSATLLLLLSTTSTTTTTSSLPLPLPSTNIPTTMPEPKPQPDPDPNPYHNWTLFAGDISDMKSTLKIHIYPDAGAPFSSVFLPHKDPSSNPKLGNYFSEHMFKLALLNSGHVTTSSPLRAHLFYLPFSINDLRNHPRVRTEPAIAEFVAGYADRVARGFPYWNASGGADHFFVGCHSVGRDAVARHVGLRNNVIQVTCCSSYFQRFYVAHKDVALPQVWPRRHLPSSGLNPPGNRHRLVFYAGRTQNARVRQELVTLWGNDTAMDIYNGSPPFPYEEGFRRSKYCLHVKGYEVNTARVSDAIHFGCIPVIISNYYELPFANVLDWTAFSVIINHQDIASLKKILLGIPNETYLNMYDHLKRVRKHFVWHNVPRGYDAFYMTVYQLWLKRGIHRLSNG